MGKPRRTFSREFKVEAVKLVTEPGRSFAEAASRSQCSSLNGNKLLSFG
jgi:transposase-like protein